jgi:hypothetical protein
MLTLKTYAQPVQPVAAIYYTLPFEIEEIAIQGGRYVDNNLYLYGFKPGKNEQENFIIVIKPDGSRVDVVTNIAYDYITALSHDGSFAFFEDRDTLYYMEVKPENTVSQPMYQTPDKTARVFSTFQNEEGTLWAAGALRNNAVLWKIDPPSDQSANGSQYLLIDIRKDVESMASNAVDMGNFLRIAGRYNLRAAYWDLHKNQDFTERIDLVPPTRDKKLYSEATVVSKDGSTIFGSYITKESRLYLENQIDPEVWPSNAYDFLSSWVGTTLFLYEKSSDDVNSTIKACVWYPVEGALSDQSVGRDLEQALIEGYEWFLKSDQTKQDKALTTQLQGAINALNKHIDILGVDDISQDGSRIFCKIFLEDETGRMQPRFMEFRIKFGNVDIIKKSTAS